MRSKRLLLLPFFLFISFFSINHIASAAPIVDLKANGSNGPLVVSKGDKVNLSWNNQNVISCTASGSWTGDKTPPDVGLSTVTINKDSSFILTCTDGTTSVKDTVLVRTTPLADDSICNLMVVDRSMVVGKPFTASVKMRNTGTNTWVKTGPTNYYLSTSFPGDPTWGVSTDNFNESSVAPGSDANFDFNGKAPDTPGTYDFEWTMRKISTNFGQKCKTTINVDVKLPPPPPPPSSCSPFTAPDFVDVPPGHPNYQAVTCLRERYCIIAGALTTNFEPNRNINRGEVAAFMSLYHNYAKKDWTWKQQDPPTFSDVDFTHIFYTHIETSKFFGFISGAGGKYNPESDWLYGFSGISKPGPLGAATTRGSYIQQLYDYGMNHNELPLCAAPTLTLNANPTTINQGDKTTVSWTSTNTDECTATAGSAGWPGVWPSNGSWLSGPLSDDVTYTLTCTGIGGSVTKSVTVTVNPIVKGLSVDLFSATDEAVWKKAWASDPIPPNIIDLKSFVTGGTGPITYTYYCDRADTGTDIKPGWFYQGSSPIDINELDNTVCKYDQAGVYHPKVIVERDGIIAMGSGVKDSIFGTRAYAQSSKLRAQDQNTMTISTTPPVTLTVDLKVNLGGGYVDSGKGALPLNNVDMKGVTGGSATGPATYKFWCDIGSSSPDYTEVGAGDIKEVLDLCNYPNPGVYTLKLEVTRDGLVAVDTAEITAALACQISEAPTNRRLATLPSYQMLDLRPLLLSLGIR